MDEQRWSGRPLLGALVRLVAVFLPVLAGVTTGGLVTQLVDGWGRLPLAVGCAATGVWLVERAARRLLPLAALLELSLLFPDRAPSRFRVALRAGSTRDLRQAVSGVRGQRPAEAAEQVVTLLGALARHDRGTRRHSERVRAYTDLVAEQLRLPRADRDRLRWAALLHDLGKLTLEPALLGKPSGLTDDEWHSVRGHPSAGAALAVGLVDFLGPWFDVVAQHHERWDGRGYPAGLAGEHITLGARIVAVADSFEVMTAGRPYRGPLSAERARAELVRCSGEQFDPQVVRAFLDVSLGRLARVAGPMAVLATVPLALDPPPDPVSLAPGAVLDPGVAAHATAVPSGHDASGGLPVTGHEHDGGAAVAADQR